MPVLRIRVNGRELDLTKERVDVEFGEVRVAFYRAPKKSDRGVKAKYDTKPRDVYLTEEERQKIKDKWKECAGKGN